MNAERARIIEAEQHEKHWRRWGTYVSERAWGTVREDYSGDGAAWDYFPFEQARSRAYRWSEDGIAGLCDNHQRLCWAWAFWNGKDPILKERMYGLNASQGNHGEDVKELYYYLDATPTCSYAKFLYKYPQARFPYEQLADENRRRGKQDGEFDIVDAGVFDGGRYWDIFIEYAKAGPSDVLARVTMANRGPEAAELYLLPTLWFRNTWAWDAAKLKPVLEHGEGDMVRAQHPELGEMYWTFEPGGELLFTDNETNFQRVFGSPGPRFAKDAFHDYVIDGRYDAVRHDGAGTKCAVNFKLTVPAGEERVLYFRLSASKDPIDAPAVFATRIAETDEFYSFQRDDLPADARAMQRQAFAGLLWSRQYYHYVVDNWLKGDPAQPAPPASRLKGRNYGWQQFYAEDVLTMPDKWEYPWFAAWDAAFHMIPLAMVDAPSAKRELSRFLREWYLHPNGQIPAYEWNFFDVNPPVHAWACWRVYQIDKKDSGKGDLDFLERAFHKLLLNFNWWVNRKDQAGDNIFEGGFLGLDNIGVFDRSKPLPTGGFLEQSDGTSWVAMYCLNLMRIAIELARTRPVYEDIASKFFEHFLYIADAMNREDERGLWDEPDGFYYDRIRFDDGRSETMRIRSMVGLIPLFAVETIDQETLAALPGFARRTAWFIRNRPDLCESLSSMTHPGQSGRLLMALCGPERLRAILKRMLDPEEFLSPYGVRSLSRFHAAHPYILSVNGDEHRIDYEPAESSSYLFGGNSNWRGPVWMPVNYLLIEALQKFGHYYGDTFMVDDPSNTTKQRTLDEVASDLSRRLTGLFTRDVDGHRAIWGANQKLRNDPHFRDYALFYEYFHGDTGQGLGASHQTGWTALIAKLIQQNGV